MQKKNNFRKHCAQNYSIWRQQRKQESTNQWTWLHGYLERKVSNCQ